MAYGNDPWTTFERSLSWFDSSIARLKYNSELDEPQPNSLTKWTFSNTPEDGICPNQVASILSSECAGPPHGFDLFRVR